MTAVHRHAARRRPPTRRACARRSSSTTPRCRASQPPRELAASAANSLGHAVEAAADDARLAGARRSRRTRRPGSSPRRVPAPASPTATRSRSRRCCPATRSAQPGTGCTTSLSQTLVRVGGAGHGPANAAMLPHTTVALRRRCPDRLAALDAAAGEPVEALARRLAAAAGRRPDLRDLGVDRGRARSDCARRRRRAARASAHAAARRSRRAARALHGRPGERMLDLLTDLMDKAAGSRRLRRGALGRARHARSSSVRSGRVDDVAAHDVRGHRRARARRRRLGLRRDARPQPRGAPRRRSRRRAGHRRGPARRARARRWRRSSPRAATGPRTCEIDPFDVPLEEKLALLFAAEAALRGDERIVRSVATATRPARAQGARLDRGRRVHAGARRVRRGRWPPTPVDDDRAAGPLLPARPRRARRGRRAGSTSSRSTWPGTRRGWPSEAVELLSAPPLPGGRADDRPARRAARAADPRVDRPRARARPHPARRGLLRRHELGRRAGPRLAALRLRAPARSPPTRRSPAAWARSAGTTRACRPRARR